ncbi:MAG: type II secretion system GspH family protein [Phycisphaerales bacterium]|nr:type II secretion system GspH family protein [Phycisphaerales bacterium]
MHQRKGHPAFTLIELLVVLAIIAILISLLAVAIARVRESGKNTICLNNLRTMGQGLENIRNAEQGLLPLCVVEQPLTANPGPSAIAYWTKLAAALNLPAPTPDTINPKTPSGRARFVTPPAFRDPFDVAGLFGPGDPCTIQQFGGDKADTVASQFLSSYQPLASLTSPDEIAKNGEITVRRAITTAVEETRAVPLLQGIDLFHRARSTSAYDNMYTIDGSAKRLLWRDNESQFQAWVDRRKRGLK